MHYNIDYSELEGQAKKDKAIEDIKDYRGAKWFDDMTATFKAGRRYNFEQFAMALSFGGIQGYPAKVWYEHIWGEWPTELEDAPVSS